MKKKYTSPESQAVCLTTSHVLCLSMTESTGTPGGTTPPEQEGGALGAPAFRPDAPWSESETE